MKKLLSVFLALALLLSFVTPAFAYQGAKTADTAAQAEEAHDPATCTDCPVVIVRGMDMMGLYIDKGTENEATPSSLIWAICSPCFTRASPAQLKPRISIPSSRLLSIMLQTCLTAMR